MSGNGFNIHQQPLHSTAAPRAFPEPSLGRGSHQNTIENVSPAQSKLSFSLPGLLLFCFEERSLLKLQ